MPVKKQECNYQRSLGWIILPAAGAVILCLLMFRGGATLYWGPLESDLTNQFYPWRVFLHRWLERGVFAFWDPHIFSGYPTIETQQMLNLNPLHLLSFVLDPKIGLTAFTAFNTLIALLGMAWALRRWGRCSWMAAALGTGLYVFGGLFAVRVMAGHLTVVSALAWWPLAALSVLRIVRSVPATRTGETALPRELAAGRGAIKHIRTSTSLRRLIAISVLAHAMVCLAGAPQYIVYLFYIDIAVLVAAARRWTWGVALVVLATVWVLALVVSAPQWMPAFWYLPYTGRATSSGGMSGFSLAGMENILLEMLMPYPFGDDVTRGHLHFKNVWETATYPGGLALILSMALIVRAVWWMLRRILQRTAAAAPITLLSAAGVVIFLFGCYMMVGGWLPGFGGFREPQKARALLAVGFAVMSAGAFDGLIRRGSKWVPALLVALVAAGIAMIAAYRYAVPSEFRELIWSFGFPMDPLAGSYYNAVLNDPAGATHSYRLAWLWGCAGIAGTLLWFGLRGKLPRYAVGVLFLVALADPYLAHAPAWLARHPWAGAGLPEPVARYFEPKLKAAEGELPWRIILHSAIINRTHHVEGLYEYHGYDPLMPAFAAGRMLVGGAKDIESDDRARMRPELMRRVGVRHDIRAWHGLEPLEPGTTSIALLEAPGATLFDVSRNVKSGSPGPNMFGPDLEGTHYVMPAEAGGKITEAPEVDAEFQQTIAALADAAAGDRNASTATSVLLPGEAIAHLETGPPDEYGVRVSLTAPALVVYKGTWLPGWRVIIDGNDKGQALFTNNWMCGALVPAGEHQVVFRYRPVAWWQSLILSGLGLAAVAGLCVDKRRRELSNPIQ